jgi:hypothetical protein
MRYIASRSTIADLITQNREEAMKQPAQRLPRLTRSSAFTILGLAAAVLSSCAGAMPYKVAHVAPTATPEATYLCALSFATSAGYTVEQANKDSGFFKAIRSERKGASSIYWGATINEELSVLVLAIPNQAPQLQVTAAANSSTGRNARLLDPTPEARADADKILAACAK